MNKHIKWILDQYKAQKWFVLIMVLFTLASSAVQIAYPYAFKRMIDLHICRNFIDTVGTVCKSKIRQFVFRDTENIDFGIRKHLFQKQ